MLKRLFARNFRKPTGLLGKLVGRLMLRGNRRAVLWTISLLDVSADDRVLEIGFGPGLGIEGAAALAQNGRVDGIDISRVMLHAATRHNRHLIADGRVALRLGDVHGLPYPSHFFDRAFAVHGIYFWQRPLDALREILRVLMPGGTLGVTILPRDRWLQTKSEPPSDLFTLYESQDVAILFREAGFKNVQTIDGATANDFRCICITGTR